MINIKLLSVAFVFSIIVSTAAGVFTTYQYTEKRHVQRELRIERQIAKELKKLTEDVLSKQQELLDLQSSLEKKYETQNIEINEKLSDYTMRVDSGFRLLDKNAANRATTNSNTGATCDYNGSASGAELSREATEFLLGLAGNADRVVNQFLTCQEYVTELRGIINNAK